MEYNPRKLFQRLFGQGDTPDEREALVDAVRQRARHGGGRTPRRCRSALGPRDQAMLDDYLETRARDRAPRAEEEAQDLSKHQAAAMRRSACRTTSMST